MTKLGGAILVAILVAVAGFVSLLSFGGTPTKQVRSAIAPPAPKDMGVLRVPVLGYPREALENNWGDPRDGGARSHHGLDILAPRGTPVIAAAAGTVEKLFQSARGGTTVYVRSPDRRWTYYYAHLAGYAPGLHEGQQVAKGERIGFVGDSGDAGPGNYHLHFSTTRTQPADRWHQGTDVNPYPLLVGRGAAR